MSEHRMHETPATNAGKHPRLGAPLRGWIQPGPDYAQKFSGWQVHAECPGNDAVPVTIVEGHDG